MLLRVHLWAIFLLLGLMCGARPVYAGTTHTCFLRDRNPHPRGVCDNVPEKMTEICSLYGRNTGLVNVDSGPGLVRFRSSKKSASSFLSKRTGSQGFICECCWNPCSIRELAEYCHQE